MLRRPSNKPSKSAEAYRSRQLSVVVSDEIDGLALNMNVMGSRDGADMLLQINGATMFFEDKGLKFEVYDIEGERIYVCNWGGDMWKYLTDTDLQTGHHSWIVNTMEKVMN